MGTELCSKEMCDFIFTHEVLCKVQMGKQKRHRNDSKKTEKYFYTPGINYNSQGPMAKFGT